MTFERILSHFQVRKRGTGKAQCICPAHADREASLTLTDGNDRALITGNRRWGYYNMSLPRVNTIPYLAKGAVIPPRSEFLAVLGDQKQGNNIETPEALLRKIVREESGGQQSSGNVRFTAQINRRTVFDEIIEEAKLRRDTSGRNPFELA